MGAPRAWSAVVLALANGGCIKENPAFVDTSAAGVPSADEPSGDGSMGTGEDGTDASSTGAGATTSASAGTTTGTVASTTAADECEAPAQVGQEPTPIDLGDQPVGAPGGSVRGAVTEQFTEAWFGVSTTAAMAFPFRRVVGSVVAQTDEPAQLCAYVDCHGAFVGASAVVECGENDEQAVSPGGREGCCGEATVATGYWCSADADVTVYLRVLAPDDAPACAEFELAYEVLPQ